MAASDFSDNPFPVFQEDTHDSTPNANTTSPPLDQRADFRSDRPVTDMANDALDRDIVARAIYEKIKSFWSEPPGPPPRYPFMVHVAGRWGSGKSTILNFLAQILKDDETLTPPVSGRTREDLKTWVVVTFNAWQHQSKRPAWWSLMNVVADQAAQQMTTRKAAWFNNQNRWFRFRINKGYELTFGGVAILIVVLGFLAYNSMDGAATGVNLTETEEITTTTDDPIEPDGDPSTASKTVTKSVEILREPPPKKEETKLDALILQIAALVTALGTIFAAFQRFFQRTQSTAEQLVALDDTSEPLKDPLSPDDRRNPPPRRDLHRRP